MCFSYRCSETILKQTLYLTSVQTKTKDSAKEIQVSSLILSCNVLSWEAPLAISRQQHEWRWLNSLDLFLFYFLQVGRFLGLTLVPVLPCILPLHTYHKCNTEISYLCFSPVWLKTNKQTSTFLLWKTDFASQDDWEYHLVTWSPARGHSAQGSNALLMFVQVLSGSSGFVRHSTDLHILVNWKLLNRHVSQCERLLFLCGLFGL